MSIPEPRRRQGGLTLVELLLGMALGLLVSLTALGTLLLSHSAAASVSELSRLQQQASYALHVMGLQLRQAGSVEAWRDDATGLHAFAAGAADPAPAAVFGTEGGAGAADSVSATHEPAPWPAGRGATRLWAQYDCTGANIEPGGERRRVTTLFSVDAGQLMCRAAHGAQPVIGDVADLQFGYRLRTGGGVRILDADAVSAAGLWHAVAGVEVCLDLQGAAGGAIAHARYADCHDVERPLNGRRHLVVRQLFHLRVH